MEIEHAMLAPLIRLIGDEKVRMAAAGHALIFLRDDTFTDQLTLSQKFV